MKLVGGQSESEAKACIWRVKVSALESAVIEAIGRRVCIITRYRKPKFLQNSVNDPFGSFRASV